VNRILPRSSRIASIPPPRLLKVETLPRLRCSGGNAGAGVSRPFGSRPAGPPPPRCAGRRWPPPPPRLVLAASPRWGCALRAGAGTPSRSTLRPRSGGSSSLLRPCRAARCGPPFPSSLLTRARPRSARHGRAPGGPCALGAFGPRFARSGRRAGSRRPWAAAAPALASALLFGGPPFGLRFAPALRAARSLFGRPHGPSLVWRWPPSPPSSRLRPSGLRRLRAAPPRRGRRPRGSLSSPAPCGAASPARCAVGRRAAHALGPLARPCRASALKKDCSPRSPRGCWPVLRPGQRCVAGNAGCGARANLAGSRCPGSVPGARPRVPRPSGSGPCAGPGPGAIAFRASSGGSAPSRRRPVGPLVRWRSACLVCLVLALAAVGRWPPRSFRLRAARWVSCRWSGRAVRCAFRLRCSARLCRRFARLACCAGGSRWASRLGLRPACAFRSRLGFGAVAAERRHFHGQRDGEFAKIAQLPNVHPPPPKKRPVRTGLILMAMIHPGRKMPDQSMGRPARSSSMSDRGGSVAMVCSM
jgi:hypothetical protein